jgi:hypothetical protein
MFSTKNRNWKALQMRRRIHTYRGYIQNRNWTALHFASASGWPLVVEILVAAGAEVNACDTRKSSIQ